MVKSRQDGILSDGGSLEGSRTKVAPSPSGGLRVFEYQYVAYSNFLPFKSYTLYQSHMGEQGLLFSLFDKIICLSPSKKINLFYIINFFLSAAAITLITIWFYLEFSLIVSLCVLASTMFSPWLVVFGKNLYWCLWLFYLPIIATMYILHYCDNKGIGKKIHGTLAIIMFFPFFVKCATGYEYITTVLVMTIVPLVYYALLNQWNFQTVVKRFTIIIGSCFLAVFASLAILCCQIYLATGSFRSGVNHIILSFLKRTYKISLDYPSLRVQNLTNSLLARSFEADLTTVLSPYFTGTFFDINSYINALPVWRLPALPFFSIRYADLVLLFLGATADLLLIRKSARQFP